MNQQASIQDFRFSTCTTVPEMLSLRYSIFISYKSEEREKKLGPFAWIHMTAWNAYCYMAWINYYLLNFIYSYSKNNTSCIKFGLEILLNIVSYYILFVAKAVLFNIYYSLHSKLL